MGDWRLDQQGRWVYDPDGPTPQPGASGVALPDPGSLPSRPMAWEAPMMSDPPLGENNPGGRGGELESFDPDNPHDPSAPDYDDLDTSASTPELVDPVAPDIAICPTCGTAVDRGRLRG